jgi:hypothetical protein
MCDDVVRSLGQRDRLSGQLELFLQSQGRDKALGDLTQHVEGLGPALGLDQVEA